MGLLFLFRKKGSFSLAEEEIYKGKGLYMGEQDVKKIAGMPPIGLKKKNLNLEPIKVKKI